FDGARFRDGDADPRNAKLRDDDAGHGVRERLDELKARVLDERDQALRDVAVVQRVLDAVRRRAAADVPPHLEIEADHLLDAALPIPDADDGVDAQIAHKYDVQTGLLSRRNTLRGRPAHGKSGASYASAGASSVRCDDRAPGTGLASAGLGRRRELLGRPAGARDDAGR